MKIPSSLKPQDSYIGKSLQLYKLTIRDAKDDYNALTENREFIKKTLNLNWPDDNLTFEENLEDIKRHEEEFNNRKSFTYGIWDLKKEKYLGCLYLYFENKPWFKNIPIKTDCVIEMWFIKEVFDNKNNMDYFIEIKDIIAQNFQFIKFPSFHELTFDLNTI